MHYRGVDEEFESFLRRLNDAVAGEVPTPTTDVGTDAQIFGLPRSGTTVLFQLLAMSGAVGYPSNLMAMFWRAPWVGARLQVHLARTAVTRSLSSLAGRTPEPLDPHEFGFFWREVCGHSANSLVVDREPVPTAELGRRLAAVRAVFAAPVVYKNFLVPAHLRRWRAELPALRYILVERDPADVAHSLLQLRQRLGTPDDGWVGPTPDLVIPTGLTVEERVLRQVTGLQRHLDTAQGIGQHDVIAVDYERLCLDPRRAVSEVLSFLGVEPNDQGLDRIPTSLRRDVDGGPGADEQTRLRLRVRLDELRGTE